MCLCRAHPRGQGATGGQRSSCFTVQCRVLQYVLCLMYVLFQLLSFDSPDESKDTTCKLIGDQSYRQVSWHEHGSKLAILVEVALCSCL